MRTWRTEYHENTAYTPGKEGAGFMVGHPLVVDGGQTVGISNEVVD